LASKKYEKSTKAATKLAGRWDCSLESSHSLPRLAKALRTEQLAARVTPNEQLVGLLQNSYAGLNRSVRRTNRNEQAETEQLVNGRRRATPCAVLPFSQVLHLTIKMLDEANRKLKDMAIANSQSHDMSVFPTIYDFLAEIRYQLKHKQFVKAIKWFFKMLEWI